MHAVPPVLAAGTLCRGEQPVFPLADGLCLRAWEERYAGPVRSCHDPEIRHGNRPGPLSRGRRAAGPDRARRHRSGGRQRRDPVLVLCPGRFAGSWCPARPRSLGSGDRSHQPVGSGRTGPAPAADHPLRGEPGIVPGGGHGRVRLGRDPAQRPVPRRRVARRASARPGAGRPLTAGGLPGGRAAAGRKEQTVPLGRMSCPALGSCSPVRRTSCTALSSRMRRGRCSCAGC